MRLIRWTTEASDQLEAAVKRIQQDNPTAARNVAQAVIDSIEQLATFPGIGRPGEVKGTRELVSPPYVVVYRSTEEIVEILHIWHGAQDWR
ncbi:MAG: type II toxin-antitoxin system RelE/ParE family toxin [Acidobacteriota bacterium]